MADFTYISLLGVCPWVILIFEDNATAACEYKMIQILIQLTILM